MWEDVTVPAGYFSLCLPVDYRIDYGESIGTDEYGKELGASATRHADSFTTQQKSEP